MDDVDIKEKDVDMNEIRRICSENTIEELEAEFEKFKKEFIEKHKNDESTVMKTADNRYCIGWLASQTDMLAEDWCIVK